MFYYIFVAILSTTFICSLFLVFTVKDDCVFGDDLNLDEIRVVSEVRCVDLVGNSIIVSKEIWNNL